MMISDNDKNDVVINLLVHSAFVPYPFCTLGMFLKALYKEDNLDCYLLSTVDRTDACNKW